MSINTFLNNFTTLAAFTIVLLVIVVVHEYGHYFLARLCGVQVEVFSIGFGKQIASFIDKNNTRWQIAPIPLGGFVKIKGQEASFDEEELKKIDKNDNLNFINKSPFQKILVVFAGPLFNILLSIVIIFTIFISYGKPDPQPVVAQITKNSPAEIGGLKENDKILYINSNKINSIIDLLDNLKKSENLKIKITVERESKNADLNIILNEDKKLGIIPKASDNFIKISIKNAIFEALNYTYNIIKSCIIGLKQLIVGKDKLQNLGGIIQIAKSSGEAMNHGLKSFLFLIAVLSINLAILNLLPIPGLDGGYLVFYILDILWIGRLITPKIRGYAVFCGFGLLIFLMLFANLNDIFRLLEK